MTGLVNVVGPWVEGDRFWGRAREVTALTRLIDEGQHSLIVAPRRVGKTSLMREVSRRIVDRYVCLHVDLEGSTTPADAVAEVATAAWPITSLQARIKDAFNNALATVKKVEKLSASDLTVTFREAAMGAWAEKGDRLLEGLGRSERPVVLFLDELAVLVCRLLQGPDEQVTASRREVADAFLSWLRRATQRPGPVRVILSGSIGLEPVLRRGKLSATINGFTPFRLDPWDRDTAIEVVRRLAQRQALPLDEAVPARLVERLGSCVPYHVQLFFQHHRRGGAPPGRGTPSWGEPAPCESLVTPGTLSRPPRRPPRPSATRPRSTGTGRGLASRSRSRLAVYSPSAASRRQRGPHVRLETHTLAPRRVPEPGPACSD